MLKRVVDSTLDQDMGVMGITRLDEQMRLAGIVVEESDQQDAPRHVQGNDPIDGPHITDEMLSRLENVDFSVATVAQCEAILNELLSKSIITEGADRDAMVDRLSGIISSMVDDCQDLDEAKIFKTFAARGTKLIKKVRKTGQAKIKSKRMGRKYRMRHKAIIKKGAIKRAKKGWFKRVMKLRSAKMGKKDAIRPIAKLMGGKVESVVDDLRGALYEGTVGMSSVRDEIVERIASIFDLMDEMYGQDDIAHVFDEALEPIIDKVAAGQLTEAAMSNDEFHSMVKPSINLIVKVVESMETGSVGFSYVEESEGNDGEA
jgi:hypothetical protein